jgi:GntR family transcriptional regulator/MocR family aminotransferase
MLDGDPRGYLPLRRAIAEHLRMRRSCRCDADQIIVSTGSQLGHALCASLLLEPEDPVWVEDPGFPETRLAYRTRTSRLIPVPIDEAGIDIDAGTAISPRPRAICVTPTHHWPKGTTMPVQRRLALLAFADSHGAWIVEDDYDEDLRFDGKNVCHAAEPRSRGPRHPYRHVR